MSTTTLPSSHQHRPLAGKAALVTGGSRGIGAAIARRLAADGAAVALTYSASQDAASALVQAIEAAGGTALAIHADAADAAQVRAAVEQTASTFGRLDILVNNAAVAIVKPAAEMTLEEFDRVVDVNVKGMFVAVQAALRHLGEGARIINIGSVNSQLVPYTGASLYAMSKGAVAGLTKALARELGARGITVNNVMPGLTDTDMNPATSEFAAQARNQAALGRYAEPREIADFVAYLASPGASYLTGAGLVVDGGYSA